MPDCQFGDAGSNPAGCTLLFITLISLKYLFRAFLWSFIFKAKDEHKVEYTTVSIPKPLVDKIKERMKGTGFPSVSSYVIYVLRQVISSIEEEEKEKQVLTKKEEESVKQRLRDLGYID